MAGDRARCVARGRWRPVRRRARGARRSCRARGRRCARGRGGFHWRGGAGAVARTGSGRRSSGATADRYAPRGAAGGCPVRPAASGAKRSSHAATSRRRPDRRRGGHGRLPARRLRGTPRRTRRPGSWGRQPRCRGSGRSSGGFGEGGGREFEAGAQSLEGATDPALAVPKGSSTRVAISVWESRRRRRGRSGDGDPPATGRDRRGAPPPHARAGEPVQRIGLVVDGFGQILVTGLPAPTALDIQRAIAGECQEPCLRAATGRVEAGGVCARPEETRRARRRRRGEPDG